MGNTKQQVCANSRKNGAASKICKKYSNQWEILKDNKVILICMAYVS